MARGWSLEPSLLDFVRRRTLRWLAEPIAIAFPLKELSVVANALPRFNIDARAKAWAVGPLFTLDPHVASKEFVGSLEP